MNFPAAITLSPASLLSAIFNDADELTDARALAARTDVLKYAIAVRRAVVIPEALARAILTADPDQLTAVVVPVKSAILFYTLWRRDDWLASDYRRYLVALERAAEKQRRDTTHAKTSRLNDMARKLTDLMSGTEADYVQYRAKIVELYYQDAREDEANFKNLIDEIVRKATGRDIYIPLSAEVLARIAEERSGVTQNNNSHEQTQPAEDRTGCTETLAPQVSSGATPADDGIDEAGAEARGAEDGDGVADEEAWPAN